jgi:preprotein translocase subunit Sec63
MEGEPEAIAQRVLAHRQAGAGPYAILGLQPGASASDVRARYKQARCLQVALL